MAYVFRPLPFDTRTSIGFTILVILNAVIAASCIYYYVAFAAIYAGICTIIETCVNDISIRKSNLNVKIGGNSSFGNELNKTHINVKIGQKVTINGEMKQLIELHRNLYR